MMQQGGEVVSYRRWEWWRKRQKSQRQYIEDYLPLCVHCVVIWDDDRIGIGIEIRIVIGWVEVIQRGGQDLPLQVTIQGGGQELVVRVGGVGLFYYEKEEYECEEIMDKEAEDIANLSFISLFLLLVYVFVIV